MQEPELDWGAEVSLQQSRAKTEKNGERLDIDTDELLAGMENERPEATPKVRSCKGQRQRSAKSSNSNSVNKEPGTFSGLQDIHDAGSQDNTWRTPSLGKQLYFKDIPLTCGMEKGAGYSAREEGSLVMKNF